MQDDRSQFLVAFQYRADADIGELRLQSVSLARGAGNFRFRNTGRAHFDFFGLNIGAAMHRRFRSIQERRAGQIAEAGHAAKTIPYPLHHSGMATQCLIGNCNAARHLLCGCSLGAKRGRYTLYSRLSLCKILSANSHALHAGNRRF